MRSPIDARVAATAGGTAGFTYWYEPGQEAHPDAVRRAGRFVDSVAALFGVTPPAKLDYYVTGSIDAAYHIIGLEFFVFASPDRAKSWAV